MPIFPNPLERLMMYRLNQGPGPMMDFLAAQAFRALCVGLKLGIFEALSGGPLLANEVAAHIKADQRGTTLLLETLEAIGYVKNQNGRYANTSMTLKWLMRNSPTNLADGLPFFESMVFERWGNLDQSIRQGKPVVYGHEWLDQQPERWRVYQEGMAALAKLSSDEIVTRAKLPANVRSLLDVGGGHALYSIAFCRKFPNLHATVFDVPEALEAARENISTNGMEARVSLCVGDFFVDDFGDGYDVVLLFNVLHLYSPEKNTELLRKIASAVNVAGVVVILEELSGKVFGTVAKAVVRLQALNFFNDLGAQTYSFDQIAEWLTKAGFTNLRRIRLFKMPGLQLVVGRKVVR